MCGKGLISNSNSEVKFMTWSVMISLGRPTHMKILTSSSATCSASIDLIATASGYREA